MAQYTTLKQAITDRIYQNGSMAITGTKLQEALLAMVDSLASGYIFAGVANASTNPGTPDEDVFYLATESGTYTNFGSAVIPYGLTIIRNNASGWFATTLYTMEDTASAGKGLFLTEAKLLEAYPNPKVGWYAYVGTSSPYAVYVCEVEGDWDDSGQTSSMDGDVTNAALLEATTDALIKKLTDSQGTQVYPQTTMDAILDKTGNVNGMAQIALKNGATFASQLTQTNAIYIIRYDFDLDEASVTIPENSVLKFEGGSISNGSIVGQNTIVKGLGNLFNNVLISGTFANDVVYSDWVSNSTDKSTLLNALHLCNGNTMTKLFISHGTYTIECAAEEDVVDSGLVIPANTDVDFQNSTINVETTDSSRYFLITILEDNVSLKNGFFIGDVETHTGTGGEWGYGVYVKGAKNIILDNLYCAYFWGDGMNIGCVVVDAEQGASSDLILSENVLIRNCVCYDNRRQGLSVIAVDGLRIYNSKFIKTGNTAMTAPGAGIDLEQNWYNQQYINDVIIDGCELSGSKGIVINDKLSMEAVRTTNITIKDTIIDGTSQIRVKQNANLYVTNCVFTRLLQYSDGDATFENCTFKGQWLFITVENQLSRDCTININSCNFDLAVFYNSYEVFKTSEILGIKTLNIVNCIFNANSDNNARTFPLIKEDSTDLEKLNLKIQNSNFLCSSDGLNLSAFGWKIWASESIVGCVINRCKGVTLYRRMTNGSLTDYSFKVKENIIRFKKQMASDYTPYFYFTGNLEHDTSLKRDFILTDNLFYFDVNEAPLWENPRSTSRMSMVFERNVSVGKIVEGNALSEKSYFTSIGDERSSGKSDFVVNTDIAYNSSGIDWQRGISVGKNMQAFYNGTYWVDCMGNKIAKHSGTTSQRPDFLDSSDTGFQYFDTTLGYTISWNGSAWVDAAGTEV